MLNFNLEPMEETKQTGTSEVQQTLASRYCEYRHLNYDVLLEYLTEDVDVEYVAMQIDQTCRHSDKLIRWGTIFRACADSGVFASMQVTKFHKMLANLIPNFKYDRTTIVKGVNEYDGKFGELRRGELKSSDDLTFIKAKDLLQAKLKGQSK